MFRQLETRTYRNPSFNLLHTHFHHFFQSNIYLAVSSLVGVMRSLRSSLVSRISYSTTELYLLETLLGDLNKNSKD